MTESRQLDACHFLISQISGLANDKEKSSQSLINIRIYVSVFVSILVTIHTMSLFGLGSSDELMINEMNGSFLSPLLKLDTLGIANHLFVFIYVLLLNLGFDLSFFSFCWNWLALTEETRRHSGPRRMLLQEVSGNLREAVRLPPGEDINEWLAVNTVDFFNQVNILYGTLTEFCTAANCPTMTAGPKYEYRWADGVTIKKPIEVSAPKYVEYLMDWIEAQLDDELIFPQKLGAPFPPNFQDVVKTIFKRLFRVYAHIYHSHFQKIEFRLIDKGELAPLYDLVESILKL
ncbi:MOB kinase activator-like 1A isoform X1 [Populus alba x Populus x berolinensis]|nr:MOB kinase activator-like 1A isoform X1 [Populus alba x Populus x berolinensis]